jgi:hypothetical protein
MRSWQRRYSGQMRHLSQQPSPSPVTQQAGWLTLFPAWRSTQRRPFTIAGTGRLLCSAPCCARRYSSLPRFAGALRRFPSRSWQKRSTAQPFPAAFFRAVGRFISQTGPRAPQIPPSRHANGALRNHQGREAGAILRSGRADLMRFQNYAAPVMSPAHGFHVQKTINRRLAQADTNREIVGGADEFNWFAG